MKTHLTSKTHKSATVKTAQQVNKKKVYAVAFSTFMLLVIVAEGIRLALQSW